MDVLAWQANSLVLVPEKNDVTANLFLAVGPAAASAACCVARLKSSFFSFFLFFFRSFPPRQGGRYGQQLAIRNVSAARRIREARAKFLCRDIRKHSPTLTFAYCVMW